MESLRPTHFLDLATELRLKIYAHLVVGSLASDSSKGLAALFLSCRIVYKELQADFINKVRPLLNAQHNWQRTCNEDPGISYEPLCPQYSVQNRCSNAAARKLVITLPMPANWVVWIRPSLRGERRVTLSRMPSFMQLIASIRPILRLRWTELTIIWCKQASLDASEFQDIDKDGIAQASELYLTSTIQTAREKGIKLDIDFATWVCKTFFRALAALKDDGIKNLQYNDRLVLNYSNAVKISNIHDVNGHLFVLSKDLIMNWTNAPVMPKPKRCWIARVLDSETEQSGWKVVYDYRSGLPEVEGALWELPLEDGKWKVKRLFTEIDGLTFEDFE
jgi:hypothetical protein